MVYTADEQNKMKVQILGDYECVKIKIHEVPGETAAQYLSYPYSLDGVKPKYREKLGD